MKNSKQDSLQGRTIPFLYEDISSGIRQGKKEEELARIIEEKLPQAYYYPQI